MANEKVRVINIDTEPAVTSVKDLRSELKQLRDTLLSTEQGTEEYNAAMTRAAEIQHTLKEQMEEVNASAMDFGQIASNTVKAVGGLVGGLQAAKATLNLFGIENEEVLKSLQKMQNLMAITQALPSIDNGIKAFKRLGIAIRGAATSMNGLKAALVSTGIGALVVAVGLLAANWDKVTAALKNFKFASTAAEDALEQQRKKIEQVRGELAKLNEDYDKWDRENKISKLNSVARKKFDDLGESIIRAEHELEQFRLGLDLPENQQGDLFDWFADQDKLKALEENVKKLKEQQQAILDNKNSYKELTKTVEDTSGAAKKAVSDLEILSFEFVNKFGPNNSIQDQIVANLIQKYGEVPIEVPITPVIEEPEEEDTSFEDAFRQKIEGTIESLRQAFGTSEEERYAEEQRALEIALNTKLITLEEYYKLSTQLAEEAAAREKQIEVQKIQTYLDIASNIGGILASVADTMDESDKKQFETAKAFNISAAVVSTIAGAIGAYTGAASNPGINAIPMVGPALAQALGITNAIAVTASGVAQIAQLSRQKFGNAHLSKGSFSSSATPNAGAVNSIIAPVQYTQDVQGASIEGAIKDTKVYVTETDITDTQKKVDVTEQEAIY